MQARLIACAAALVAGALIWNIPRQANDLAQHAGDDVAPAGAAVVLPGATPDLSGEYLASRPTQATAYRPGEVQRGLLELVSLDAEGASPDDLLRLAELIYLGLLGADHAAVPEALDFLASGQDLRLAGQPGGAFDFKSLRLALIDALRRIGGPVVERALAAELQRTQSYTELEALAQSLEWLHPGRYRDAILDRATAQLAALTSGVETDASADTAPLFRVMQAFGDRDMATALIDVPYWLDDYAEIAMANLPGGQGLDRLTLLSRRELRQSDNSRALHLLAQLAVTEQPAEQALLELALSGQIPDRHWPLIAEIIMGDRQLQLEEPPADPQRVGSLRGSNPFSVHTISDRQVQTIYSVNYSAVLSPFDAARRLALIDRLLNEPISLAAREALWATRELLSGSY